MEWFFLFCHHGTRFKKPFNVSWKVHWENLTIYRRSCYCKKQFSSSISRKIRKCSMSPSIFWDERRNRNDKRKWLDRRMFVPRGKICGSWNGSWYYCYSPHVCFVCFTQSVTLLLLAVALKIEPSTGEPPYTLEYKCYLISNLK